MSRKGQLTYTQAVESCDVVVSRVKSKRNGGKIVFVAQHHPSGIEAEGSTVESALNHLCTSISIRSEELSDVVSEILGAMRDV